MSGFTTFLGYAWRVVVNCFYLFIVLYVFDKLHERFEIIVAAILGLIIRSHFLAKT
jgi:hypothetical protein